MKIDAAVAAITSLWASPSRAGGAALASWPDDDDGARCQDARARVLALVDATRAEIPWGPIEKPPREDLESMLGIFCRARVEAESGILFRLSARTEQQGSRTFVRVRAEWTTTSQTLEDHAEVAQSLEAATRHVRALLEAAAFGASNADVLGGIEGVTLHALDAKEAFARRTLQDDVSDEDCASGRLECALGTMRGIAFRRADHTVWSAAINAATHTLEGILAERVPDPWCDELVLDAKLILVTRAFPRSELREAEQLRPLVARIERVSSSVCSARISRARRSRCVQVGASKTTEGLADSRARLSTGEEGSRRERLETPSSEGVSCPHMLGGMRRFMSSTSISFTYFTVRSRMMAFVSV